jgi:hypothetical protein
VLPGMGDRLVSEAEALTPEAWLASRSEAVPSTMGLD